MRLRNEGDIICPETAKVRVLNKRCDTCVFWPDNRMSLKPGRFEDIVKANLEAGSLLTCHKTLPYGPFPKFGPAACNGYWRKYFMDTEAGRIAFYVIGVVMIDPPKPEEKETS